MRDSKIRVTEFDYDKRETVEVATVGTRQLGKSISPEQLACVIDNMLNSFVSGRMVGMEVGNFFVDTHPSLQGQFMEFLAGALIGYSEEYARQFGGQTDLRNEGAFAMATALARAIKDQNMGQRFI